MWGIFYTLQARDCVAAPANGNSCLLASRLLLYCKLDRIAHGQIIEV
jgi:hypothetical protein